MSSAAESLAALIRLIGEGGIRVVDLTQPLTESTPVISLPEQVGKNSPGFSKTVVSNFDADGPAWAWYALHMGEHCGTHFDSPNHWITGREHATGGPATIPPEKFVAAACVIDVSAKAAADPDYLLHVDDVRAFEAEHGRIEDGSLVLMRTDWSKRTDPVAYQNLDETGQHTPGPDTAAVQFLVDERQVLGFGSEAIGTDAGQAFHLKPPYPCHYYMHGSGRFGLQCLTNLDLLPPTGAVIIAAPLKIKEGSGSPLRVLALVPERAAARSRNVKPTSSAAKARAKKKHR
jgi:kynurenine formamidase